MVRIAFLLLSLCCVADAAEAFRKFVITPIEIKTILADTCVSYSASLVNADGNPTTVERDKEVLLTSTAASTVFFAYFVPNCVDKVKGARWTMSPGQTAFRFSIREELSRMQGKDKDLPHTITITVSARGVQAANHEILVRTNDCGVLCRDSCMATRAVCTKECGGEKEKVSLDNQTIRGCWRGCYEAEEKCLTHCEKNDERYMGGSCSSSCSAFCEERQKCCYGRCYFHAESRNTSLGARCADDCHVSLDKCYQSACRQ